MPAVKTHSFSTTVRDTLTVAMRKISWWFVGGLAASLVACGGGLTAVEYAETVEDLVVSMEARFAAADAVWESEQPTLEGALRYWEERLDHREEFLESIEALVPPKAAADMHAAALSVFRRITEADIALAARVAEYDEVSTHRQWLDTPEGQASLTILEEVYAFCRSSQSELDATQDRETLEDVPWLPQEMSQVIKVAFGCPP